MFNENSCITKSQYTYSDLTKPAKRALMNVNGVSELGTQSGGFGAFVTHFVVLSNQSAANVRNDAIRFCNENGLSKDEFISSFPSLKELLK